MPTESIGIVYSGRRGEAIAMNFAKHGFLVRLFEIDPARAAGYMEGSKKSLEIMGLKGNVSSMAIDPDHMQWVSRIDELEGCTLLIEAIHDSKSEKREYLRKLGEIAQPGVPLLSHSYLSLPSELAQVVRDKSNFAVGYFYDIEYAATNVELVYHEMTRPLIIEKIESLLKQGGFLAVGMLECPGFIHNRVGCLGILSLFRFYDQKVLSYENLGKYFIVSRFEPYILDIPLATEIKTELFDLLPLIKILHRHYGSRYYLPAFFKEELARDNLEEKIAQHSLKYGVEEPAGKGEEDKNISSVYLTGIDLIHNNIFCALANKNLRLYLDSRDLGYLALFKKQSPKLFARYEEKITVIGESDHLDTPDLAIDFRIEPFPQKMETLRALQNRFGPHLPILLNTPIYRINDLACAAPNPSIVFGMYVQKNYAANTEMVILPSMDIPTFIRLRKFIKNTCNGCIETQDADVRPLAFMILSKMIESVRILEEGLADMQTIDRLGVDRSVFKDMDLFGLDTIVFLCEYLQPRYGDVFKVPRLLASRVASGKTGYAAGAGFIEYSS